MPLGNPNGEWLLQVAGKNRRQPALGCLLSDALLSAADLAIKEGAEVTVRDMFGGLSFVVGVAK